MTDSSVSRASRRPELERAYQHLVDVAAATDLSGIADPRRQWLATLRASMSRYGAVGAPPSLEGVAFTPVMAGGVPAEWAMTPSADPATRIVYTHGGGWAAGSPHDYRPLSAILARMTGASILMVDYRLAPEHLFPAGLDDCVAALAWAARNGPRSEATGLTDRDPPTWLVLAGDSAGGNLAAATCLRAAESGARMPDRLVLIAGTLDNHATTERVGLDDPICAPDVLVNCTETYLPQGHPADDPHVSPVFASTQSLSKFPPTLIQVGSIEALAYDGKKFMNRLQEAGVRVTLSLWPGVPHVWHMFLGLFPEAEEALREIAAFVARGARGPSR